jgi:ATP-dependent exoDNAse (exonuclease V) alpha subunit
VGEKAISLSCYSFILERRKMQVETELKRDFCPFCSLPQFTNALKCIKCGTEDLIPNPYFHPEQDILVEEMSQPEKSKLELDETAVGKLTKEPFGFLTGLAGTGKTTLINEINRLYPNRFELSATTGIAAVNLNSKTLNSTLKYFDTKSLENAWREQLLHMNLRKVRARKEILGIDEGSMLPAEQLDIIMNAVDDINQDGTGKTLGVWIFGDICQLPPVKAKYIFKSDYWDRFDSNTVRLTKVWRQDNEEFMRGINLVRAGKGVEAMEVFKSCGVSFKDQVDDSFEGTTLIPLNDNVDAYNEKRLRDVEGKLIRCMNVANGMALPEWNKLIPGELRVKIGAYVMILSNDIDNWAYVNGDCGWIRDYDPTSDTFSIQLKRTNQLVCIGRIRREHFYNKEPEKYHFTPKFTPYNDYKTGDWVIGTMRYHPLRLAYASTIHKSQGLSLDLVQIDTRPQFFGYDSMGYVSISRARTPEGLVLVGKPEVIGRKIKMNKEVMKYV